MKKRIIVACLAAVISLAAGTAGAESIKGRFGLTGKLGFIVPAENESDFFPNRTDSGFIGGGGAIYGIDDRLALVLEGTHASFGSETGDFGVTDLSLGGQYRLAMPRNPLVPYLGAGVDILVADYDPYDGSRQDVDTTVGMHLSGGVDYFLHPNLALNAELRGVLTGEADIKDRFGDHVGNFDGSGFSGTVGIRYFIK
ncbi:porin family protein [Geomonas sp. RF6]|uniref:outer membrane beta-barrel protein n=1 Tax=Geomonas sp. RF6 TaxID=2897342 RepID=UPI001E5740AE|nr:outer membrane beta-barrel protein [Geomonas sp. RF6]UFS71243.1 porin family protein [Geomonas sp. RF6]